MHPIPTSKLHKSRTPIPRKIFRIRACSQTRFMYLASSILMYINKKSRPRVELFFLGFFSMSACQCKAQIRPRPVIFVCVFFQYYLRNIRNLEEEKKCDTAVSKNLFRKKSKLTKRKCDMVSIQYLSMLHVRVELMNGPTHEVYKPTCHGIDIHVRSRVSRSIYKLFYSSLFFNF